MIWFTSDPHYWHKNIIRFCKRPFADIVEHNEGLINRHNTAVQPNDEVYILGDFAFASKARTIEVAKQLNGIKYLIRGNHDPRSEEFWTTECGFQWVKDYYELKVHNVYQSEEDETKFIQYHQPIVLCHYPLLSWNGMVHGAWHFHGHCHGTLQETPSFRKDIGVDTNNMSPWSYDELKAVMAMRSIQPAGHIEDKLHANTREA